MRKYAKISDEVATAKYRNPLELDAYIRAQLSDSKKNVLCLPR